MKQINEKRVYGTKKRQKSNFVLLVTIIIFTFFLGFFSSHNVLQVKTFFGDVLDDIGKSIYQNFFISEKFKINLNLENYNRILKSRDKAIKQGIMLTKNNPWVRANLNIGKKTYDANIKLRGSHSSNWEDKKKLGFKIKLRRDQRYKGMKEFSIQHPEQREYIGEYLFMKILELEGLIFSRSNFYSLDINGNNYGLYFFQESLFYFSL